MRSDTQKRIEQYKAMLPAAKERIVAVALLLAMSVVMMASTSYAWLTLSRAPEVKGMNTTISGNGNLEIALVSPNGAEPGASKAGDSSASDGQTLLGSNITWGNLVNLSDSRYGLDHISLRPALLTSYDRDKTPLSGATYSSDGRLESTTDKYSFASWKQSAAGQWYFDAADVDYGVRAIASTTTANISGNAILLQANELLKRSESSYSTAQLQYKNLITNQTLASTPGVKPEVKGMDALQNMIQAYAQDQAQLMLDNRLDNQHTPADFSGQVTYMYRLVLQVRQVLEEEGQALLYLANYQAYVNSPDHESTETFKTVEELVAAYKNNFAGYEKYNIKIDSLKTYSADYENIAKCVEGLKLYAEKCDPDTVTNPPKVTWDEINPYVKYLVDIQNTTMSNGETTFKIGNMADLGLRALSGFATSINSSSKAADVVLGPGIWKNLEQRLPKLDTETLQGAGTGGKPIQISVKVRATVEGIPVTMTMYADLSTGVNTKNFTSGKDLAYSDALKDTMESSEEKVAQDTYGMAIDLWVRTNISGSVLTLEGNLKTEQQRVYGVDKNGQRVELYVITYEDMTVVDAYKLEDVYYDAASHTQLEIPETGTTIEEKTQEVVVGYDGVNRIWEDYKTLIESGLLMENNTTQGAGSCYVFYADPSDQTRILHLLQAFTITFVDQEGNVLANAKLDTEHYYSVNGKTTVPLKIGTSSGKAYEDENGETKNGIMELVKNEATWITALIYLDGQGLTNEDVLAVGEIEGLLNIQFGSSIALDNQDDTDLKNEYRDITAVATAGGMSSTNTAQPISFEYDKNAKEVTVTLTVDGDQPNNISAFFVRTISQSQGTKGDTVSFTRNGSGNTWTATFTLNRPGTYSLRNLIVDGSYYLLDDGTESGGIDNFPTVKIDGMRVSGVSTTLAKGVTMTANNSVTADVYASIDVASADLMPKNVRALFRSATGREFTAQLYQVGTTDQWSGKVTFTESGTYTLQYLVLDGDYTELDDTQQTSHILYLGLRAQVWSDGVVIDEETGERSNTFDFTHPVELPMRMKIYDDAGNEIKALEGVYLYYHSTASVLDQDGFYGKMQWNGEYYTGTFPLDKGGTFVFNRVQINQGIQGAVLNTVSYASRFDTIEAIVKDPPVFIGSTTKGYQLVTASDRNGEGIGAYLSVKMDNAQTAKIWAEIVDRNNNTYFVECTKMDKATETEYPNAHEFKFQVPIVGETQDGRWTLKTVYMQNCANESKTWIPVSGGAPTRANSYVIDVSNNTTKVVETINLSITQNGTKYDDKTFGKDANGTTIGAFMQEYKTGKVTFTVTDWEGELIDVESITWKATYDGNMQANGGYTSSVPPDIAGQTVANGGSAELALRVAGNYTSTVSIVVKGKTIPIPKSGPSFEVYSVAPTVKITGISPTGTFDVDKNGAGSGHTSNGATASFTDTTANVYFKCDENVVLFWSNHNFTQPRVTIALSNMGAATKATLDFGSAHVYNGNTSVGGYEWTANGNCVRNIGYFRSKTAATDEKTPAGTITANQLVLTYNGILYTFTIPTITINNPY